MLPFLFSTDRFSTAPMRLVWQFAHPSHSDLTLTPVSTVLDAENITLELLQEMLRITALMRQQLEEMCAELTAKLIAPWVSADAPFPTDGQFWDPILLMDLENLDVKLCAELSTQQSESLELLMTLLETPSLADCTMFKLPLLLVYWFTAPTLPPTETASVVILAPTTALNSL